METSPWLHNSPRFRYYFQLKLFLSIFSGLRHYFPLAVCQGVAAASDFLISLSRAFFFFFVLGELFSLIGHRIVKFQRAFSMFCCDK